MKGRPYSSKTMDIPERAPGCAGCLRDALYWRGLQAKLGAPVAVKNKSTAAALALHSRWQYSRPQPAHKRADSTVLQGVLTSFARYARTHGSRQCLSGVGFIGRGKDTSMASKPQNAVRGSAEPPCRSPRAGLVHARRAGFFLDPYVRTASCGSRWAGSAISKAALARRRRTRRGQRLQAAYVGRRARRRYKVEQEATRTRPATREGETRPKYALPPLKNDRRAPARLGLRLGPLGWTLSGASRRRSGRSASSFLAVEPTADLPGPLEARRDVVARVAHVKALRPPGFFAPRRPPRRCSFRRSPLHCCAPGAHRRPSGRLEVPEIAVDGRLSKSTRAGMERPWRPRGRGPRRRRRAAVPAVARSLPTKCVAAPRVARPTD